MRNACRRAVLPCRLGCGAWSGTAWRASCLQIIAIRFLTEGMVHCLVSDQTRILKLAAEFVRSGEFGQVIDQAKNLHDGKVCAHRDA